MIYLEKQDIHATLTTWIYCAFAQLFAAEQANKYAYINWPKNRGRWLSCYWDENKFAEVPNAYDWYFSQIQPEPRTETWTWEDGFPDAPIPLYAQPLEVIKDYYQRNLIFNNATEWRGLALKNKYNIDFEKAIGITWRGTDIYLESQNGFAGRTYTPIERYYKWIDKALEEIPDARIMCTAEESGILDPLLKRYPQAFVIEEFYQAPKGGKHNPERFSPLSGYERGLQPVLMLWLFSKCAWYIKNRASTSGIAGWLNKGNVVSIGHPANLGFPVNIDGDEFNGQVYDI